MPSNGLILLGYARSAGSGDQPVPGLVTSRRDRGSQQVKKQKQQAQQDEERKVRQRQEVAAQYLKRKWKEEDDRKKKRKDKDKDSDDDRARRHHSDDDDDDKKTEIKSDRREVLPEPAEGKWVSQEDVKNRVLELAAQPREAPRPATGAGLAGPKEPERRGFLPVRQQEAVSMPMDPVVQQKRKKALASAFGLDDDDGEARRELELAARIKRQRVETRPPAGDAGTGLVDMRASLAAATPPAEKRPMDMYEQLRALAEWKRKCKGNRVPMPDFMVSSIGATAGLQHTVSGETSAPSSSRRHSRSRSAEQTGSRRFAEQRRSRSRKTSRRSRSRRGGKSRSRSRGKR